MEERDQMEWGQGRQNGKGAATMGPGYNIPLWSNLWTTPADPMPILGAGSPSVHRALLHFIPAHPARPPCSSLDSPSTSVLLQLLLRVGLESGGGLGGSGARSLVAFPPHGLTSPVRAEAA